MGETEKGWGQSTTLRRQGFPDAATDSQLDETCKHQTRSTASRHLISQIVRQRYADEVSTGLGHDRRIAQGVGSAARTVQP